MNDDGTLKKLLYLYLEMTLKLDDRNKRPRKNKYMIIGETVPRLFLGW